MKGICIILILIAGKLDSRHFSTTVFLKEVDCFIGVTCCSDQSKIWNCRISSMSNLLELWQNAVDKVKGWTFLNKEYRNCAKMRQMQ